MAELHSEVRMHCKSLTILDKMSWSIERRQAVVDETLNRVETPAFKIDNGVSSAVGYLSFPFLFWSLSNALDVLFSRLWIENSNECNWYRVPDVAATPGVLSKTEIVARNDCGGIRSKGQGWTLMDGRLPS